MTMDVWGDESDEMMEQKPTDSTAVAKPDAQTPQGGQGPLLDETDEKKVVQTMVRWLQAQRKARKRRRVEWERNRLWIKGVRGVRARPLSEDLSDFELHVPLGVLEMAPVMDRADELIDRVAAHLLVDPPVPEAEPSSNEDADRDSAEFTTRMLTVEGSESGFNMTGLCRRAVRKGGVYGSAFKYWCIDPTGNGWRPMEIMALPEATTKDDAILDPLTGGPVTDEGRLKLRYVMPDGNLTDDPTEADKQWLPKVRCEILTGNHVAFLPETCSGINDALGVLILNYMPLSDAKQKFEKLAKMEDQDLRKLLDWKPEDEKHVRPAHASNPRPDSGGEKIPDDATICTLTLYFRGHSAYPKGAYIVAAGGETVLHKQTWSAVVEKAGKTEEECLDLPLSQVRQLDDDVDDDPMGRGLIEKLGPVDEVRGTIVLAWMEYLDQAMHRNTFLPVGTIVQPGALSVRDGTPIYFNPQGQPVEERIPPFPPDAKEFFDRATEAGDSATGLHETAQGLESPNSQSGKAKEVVVQQAQVNLSGMRQNLADAIERSWRIVAQLVRAFYTVPQRLKYVAEDGAYKEEEWSRADLGSTRQIRIARGSFTQMAPEAKQALADQMLAVQVIAPEEYERIITTGMQPKLGLKDNPHTQRVRRQCKVWREGPPEGWMPPQPVPQMDPVTGMATLVPAPDPSNPFADQLLVDDEQDVAVVRHRELRRLMASTAYQSKPPEWRAMLDGEYQRARQAAGVSTVAEQQVAMQQQQQMQAEQNAQNLGAQSAEKDKDRDAKAVGQERTHQMNMERDAMKMQGTGPQLAA